MRRRALLRRIAAGGVAQGAAGCLDRSGARGTGESTGSTPETNSPTATPRQVDGTPGVTARTPANDVPRRVDLDGVDDGELRSAFDVATSVTVPEPRVTVDHTARVEITVENHGDRNRTLTYEARECDLNVLTGTRVDGDVRLLLAPADAGWTPASDRCWRVRHPDVSCGIPVTTHEVDLPAGEDVTRRFDLWTAPDGACMPPGRYEFAWTFDGAATLPLTLCVTQPHS